MLELQNIVRFFREAGTVPVKALNDVSLSVSPGEYVVVVGANGSGKSTLLNVVAGNVRPDSGSVIIGDKNVTLLEDYQRSRWIARIFQNPFSGTVAEMSITDNFRLAAVRTKKKTLMTGIDEKFRKRIQEKISLLGMGLENKLSQPVGTLSGGQRQALTLVMAVMDDAKILLLDEPTAALDPRSAEQVLSLADKIIKEYSLTAIMVTHNLKDAHRYGNRIICMNEGKIARDYGREEKKSLGLEAMSQWFL